MNAPKSDVRFCSNDAKLSQFLPGLLLPGAYADKGSSGLIIAVGSAHRVIGCATNGAIGP